MAHVKRPCGSLPCIASRPRVVYPTCAHPAPQVPLEFDFVRERLPFATAIRSSLAAHSAAMPALRRVVVPAMVPGLSSGKVLTMEYLDGVPLLDIAGMDLVGGAGV